MYTIAIQFKLIILKTGVNLIKRKLLVYFNTRVFFFFFKKALSLIISCKYELHHCLKELHQWMFLIWIGKYSNFDLIPNCWDYVRSTTNFSSCFCFCCFLLFSEIATSLNKQKLHKTK